MLQIQAEEASKPKAKIVEPVEEYEYIAYNCPSCTFLNNENPGKNCTICGSPAPETAKVLKANPQLLLKKTEEDEKLKKEIEANKLEQERLEKAKLKEQRRKEYLENARLVNIAYFKDAAVVRYILASNNSGKSRKPMLVGCALQGSGWLDLHLKWVRYRKEYIAAHFADNFDSELQTRQLAIEALVPALFFPRNCVEILRVSELAVCRINLASVNFVCQLGDSIS